MPSTPICSSAPFTSSSTNGFTIAVTSFICSALLACGSGDLLSGCGWREMGRGAQPRPTAQRGEVVRGLGVLDLVDAGDLVLLADAEADRVLDERADREGDDERVDHHGERGDRL